MRITSIALAIVVFAADQLTKWVVKNVDWLRNYDVIDGFLRIGYVRNEGIAFGIFHDLDSTWKPIILSITAIVAIGVVLYYIWKAPTHRRSVSISLGLLLGGITGNLVDRLIHQYVTDFIEVHWRSQISWPTFNIADAAITCGVLLVLYETFVTEEDHAPQEKEPSPTNESSGI